MQQICWNKLLDLMYTLRIRMYISWSASSEKNLFNKNVTKFSRNDNHKWIVNTRIKDIIFYIIRFSFLQTCNNTSFNGFTNQSNKKCRSKMGSITEMCITNKIFRLFFFSSHKDMPKDLMLFFHIFFYFVMFLHKYYTLFVVNKSPI